MSKRELKLMIMTCAGGAITVMGLTAFITFIVGGDILDLILWWAVVAAIIIGAAINRME